MAIAPSKLGRFVLQWDSEDALLRGLREAGLVNNGVSDDELMILFRTVREEHAGLPSDEQAFNSPHERVRVFLEPYLSEKGRQWAVPVASLDLPDGP